MGPSNHIFTVGLESSLKVCVANCKAGKKEFILLRGKLYADTVLGTALPPPLNLGGELALVADSPSGYWHKAFGVPILHLR